MAQHMFRLRASGPKVGAVVFSAGLLVAGFGVSNASPAPQVEGLPSGRIELVQEPTGTDSIPPSGSIQVAPEERVTNRTSITLRLQASDESSPVDSMQFSIDGESWLAPEPYRQSRAWELTGEDGVKTIYVRFRDSAGNWMQEPAVVEVTLDRQPPQNPSIILQEGAELTNQREIGLQLSADGADQARVSEDSTFADVAWVPVSELSATLLSQGDGDKIVFAQFRDLAGNVSDIVSDRIILDTTPPLNPRIVINEGRQFTNRREVQLRLSAEEAVEMMVGEGSLAVASWQPIDTLITFTLQGPEGERRVLVRFRDRAGNATDPVAAAIVLDQTPPRNPQIVLAEGREFVNSRSVLVGLSAEGAWEANLDGDLVSADGDTGWVSYRNQLVVDLTEGEGPKRVQVRYRDQAGNVSAAAAAAVVVDVTPPSVMDLQVVDLQPRQATIAWETNEPTRAEIVLTRETPRLERVLADSVFENSHTLPLTDLEPGTGYQLQVRAIDRASNSSADSTLSLVTLSETVVQGLVFFPKTQIPVEGGIARLGELQTETDMFGAFQFVHPPVGALTFVVEKEGFDTHESSLEIPKTGKLEQTVELASDVYTHPVEGRVTDLRGNPLAGARVVLFNPDGTESELATATDDSGRYVLEGVPQGQRRLRFFLDYFDPVEPVLEVASAVDLDEKLTATPIEPPAHFLAAPRSIRSIGIEWEPVPYPTTLGYLLYRAPSPDSAWVAVHDGFLPPTQDAFIDSGLAIGTSYHYALSVVNIDTVLGRRSRSIASATLDLFAPNQTFVSGLERQVSHAAPSLADLDSDGDLDLLLAEGTGNIFGYRNIGSATVPRWQRDDELARGLMKVGGNSRVAFADLDGDGDVDLFRGIGDGRLRAYRNTGSDRVPLWKPDAELSRGTREEGRNLTPALADLDGDTDVDLLVGQYRAALAGYENVGGSDHPAWQITDKFTSGLTDLANNNAPVFADLDGDGDYDLLIGEGLGRTLAFENIGTAANPKWRLQPQFSTGIADVGDQAVPTMGDLDGDGDLDLLIGAWNGKVFGFENNTVASVRVLAGVKALK